MSTSGSPQSRGESTDDDDFLVNAIDFCRQFEAADPGRRYALGANHRTLALAASTELAGIVDDFSDALHFEGIPLVRSDDLSESSLVVSCSTLMPTSAARSLDAVGVRQLSYFAFADHTILAVPQVPLLSGFRADYANHRDCYEDLRHRFGDLESLDTFDRLVEFRLTGNIAHLGGFRYDIANQYFEDFLQFRPSEVFYDIGSYDGATALKFAELSPDYEAIVAFEPDPINRTVVDAALRALRHSTVLGLGLSETSGSARFAATGDSWSRLSATGDLEVQMAALDDLSIPAPTFMKLDIEGHELPALVGSRGTVAAHRPRIAVSVYHRPEDFRVLATFLDELLPGSDIRMRHYTEGTDETVMFFLP